jgi:hypothetical protein
MPWPFSQDYNEVVQHPQTCFADAELRGGEAAVNALGLPIPCSGNFSDVYRLNCPATRRSWAVKCFTRQVPGLRERYQQISRYLGQVKLPFTIDFTFLDRGIQVRGAWYPAVKMEWVEGLTLNQFVKNNLDNPRRLERVGRAWVRLAGRLREANVAHCDLQHGNVLIVSGDKARSLSVKLVDYDGMWVPALDSHRSSELGHTAYQHPQRLHEGTYSLEVDRFSHLVIYTAIRSLMVGGRPLWERYDNGANLLFCQRDFQEPSQSALLRELLQADDPEVRRLAETLSWAAQQPLDRTPLLEELVAGEQPGRPVRMPPGDSSASLEDEDDVLANQPDESHRDGPHEEVDVGMREGNAGDEAVQAGRHHRPDFRSRRRGRPRSNVMRVLCGRCGSRLIGVEQGETKTLLCPKCGSKVVLSDSGEVSALPARRPDRATLVPRPPPAAVAVYSPADEEESRRDRRTTMLYALGITGLLSTVVAVGILFALYRREQPDPKVARASPETPRVDWDIPRLGSSKPATQAKEESAPAKEEPKPAKEEPKPAKEEPKPAKEEPPKDDVALREIVVRELSDKALKRGRTADRVRALEDLGKLGPKAKGASRTLCALLLDNQVEVALAATLALKEVNPDLHRVVMLLLRDSEYDTRIGALSELGKMKEAGAPAIPLILNFKEAILQYPQTLKNVPPYEKNPAGALVLDVLASVAPKDKAWTTQVALWLRNDKNIWVRAKAASLLTQIEEGKAAAELLAKRLEIEQDQTVLSAIVLALGQLGSDAKVAEKKLALMASVNPSAAMREACEQALRRIRAGGP